jgi:hypothetical protein
MPGALSPNFPIVLWIFIGIIVVFIAAIIYWIWMIFDCASHKFASENEKVVWILIIGFFVFFGAIAYHILVKRKHKSHHESVVEVPKRHHHIKDLKK